VIQLVSEGVQFDLKMVPGIMTGKHVESVRYRKYRVIILTTRYEPMPLGKVEELKTRLRG